MEGTLWASGGLLLFEEASGLQVPLRGPLGAQIMKAATVLTGSSVRIARTLVPTFEAIHDNVLRALGARETSSCG
jgi:hypothetical protein